MLLFYSMYINVVTARPCLVLCACQLSTFTQGCLYLVYYCLHCLKWVCWLLRSNCSLSIFRFANLERPISTHKEPDVTRNLRFTDNGRDGRRDGILTTTRHWQSVCSRRPSLCSDIVAKNEIKVKCFIIIKHPRHHHSVQQEYVCVCVCLEDNNLPSFIGRAINDKRSRWWRLLQNWIRK